MAVVYILNANNLTTDLSKYNNINLNRLEKINKMPFSYFDKRTYGETLSVITNDADNLSMGINQSATELVRALATIIGIFFMMLSINVTMTFITLLLIPISLILMGLIVKNSQQHFKNNQDYLASVNGKVEEIEVK